MKQITLKEYPDFSDDYEGINKSVAYVGRTFESYDTNISINSDFSRKDYDYFRPSSRLPQKDKEKIEACMKAYDEIGIVHNVIDLMSEFACDGIKLVHPIPSVQRFYERWFEKVKGYHTSERFLNYLYRSANVFCIRDNAKIDKKTTGEWKRAFALDEGFREPKVPKREIPIKYTFKDPRKVEVIDGMGSDLKYGIRVSFRFRQEVLSRRRNPTPVLEEMQKHLMSGNLVPLKEEDLIVTYYKKDDWDDWAKPMINPIISNLITLEKMHLADISALDGAISNIRLWRLGIIDPSNPAGSILPNRNALNKLRSILHNRGTGGVLDLVWGPELDFKESSTSVHQFLGSSKYEQNMREIYGGLGITSSLLGGDGSGKTASNNFISLQTLIKRLEYGRKLLVDFWNAEIRRVQKAMGFTKPAKVKFAVNLLNDEATKNKLLLDLVDRNIISTETILKEFDFDSELERNRLKREIKNREKDKMSKAGPYFDPQKEDRLKEILLQNGGVAPSEVGVELQPRKEGEKSMREMLHEMTIESNKSAMDAKKPPGTSGRPKNAKDQQKRKQKVLVKPAQGFINKFLWANAAQKEISSVLDDAFLSFYKKKNMRSLTASEKQNIENVKFKVLCNMEPFSEIKAENLSGILKNGNGVDPEIIAIAKILTKQFMTQNNRQPTMDEIREIQSSAYAVYHGEN